MTPPSLSRQYTSRETFHAQRPSLMHSLVRSTTRASARASAMRRVACAASSDGRPGRVDAEHIGGSSTVTSRTPRSGASRVGATGSSLTAAMAVVRPTLASAEPWAVVTTPRAKLTGRARPRGRPSGRAPSAMNLS